MQLLRDNLTLWTSDLDSSNQAAAASQEKGEDVPAPAAVPADEVAKAEA